MTKKLLSDIIKWDIKSWSKALLYWDKSIAWDDTMYAMELGSGHGGLSLWLASKKIKTVCSDFKDAKVRGVALHQKYKVESLILYEDVDVLNIPYENIFDVIVFKSIMGGIKSSTDYQSQLKAFEEIRKALKPSGKLLFAENLVASPLHRFLRKSFVKWGNSWRYVTVAEMKEFLKGFSSYDLHTTGVLGVLGRNEMQRDLLTTLDELFLEKICPESWKYIVYGVATK